MYASSIGIRELKNNLSKYMRLVKQGETILVTEHGKAVGRIIPEGESLEERLQGLISAGVISWNGKKLPPRKPMIVNRGPGLASDIISEDRNVDYLS